MILDSELSMAIDTTFNSILNEIQLSKLNFNINVTPYAAYITLKKSTVIDRTGTSAIPSPPILRLLEKAIQDRFTAENENVELKTALLECEKRNEELSTENGILRKQLALVTKEHEAETNNIKAKEKEVVKYQCENKLLSEKVTALEKTFNELSCESNREITGLKKLIKVKEKKVHNLTNKFNNISDTNGNLKTELSEIKVSKSKLDSEKKKLDQKIKKLEQKKAQNSVFVQTNSTIDLPYSIEDPLPPIFGSKLCWQSKPIFQSNSLPELSLLSWVKTTDEDAIKDRAEESLIEIYGHDVDLFYLEARKKAAKLNSLEECQDWKLELG